MPARSSLLDGGYQRCALSPAVRDITAAEALADVILAMAIHIYAEDGQSRFAGIVYATSIGDDTS